MKISKTGLNSGFLTTGVHMWYLYELTCPFPAEFEYVFFAVRVVGNVACCRL